MILHLKVKPSSAKNILKTDEAGNYIMHLNAKPVNGEANKQLVAFLSMILDLPKTKIAIAKGATSSYKKIEIDAPENRVFEMLKSQVAR